MNQTPQEQPQRKKISAEEFVKIWRGDYKEVEGYEEYYGALSNEEFVFINNIEVANEVEINSQILGALKLTDSVILHLSLNRRCSVKKIIIYDSNIKSISIRNSSIIGTVSINNSNCNGIGILNDSGLLSLGISNSSYLKVLSIKYNSTIEGLRIESSNIGDVRIQNNSKLIFTEIKSLSKFRNIHSDSGSEVRRLFISDSIGDYIIIMDKSIVKDIFIRSNVTLNSIELSKSHIDRVVISNKVRIYDFTIRELSKKCKNIEIQGVTISRLKIKTTEGCDITVKDYRYMDGNTRLKSIVHALELTEFVFHKDSHLHISNTKINSIYFDSFLNEGTIVFNNVEPITDFDEYELYKGWPKLDDNHEFSFKKVDPPDNISIIEIINSDLGNTQFIGCDLDFFDEFEFENSKMLNVFLADTVLPEARFINQDGNDENEQRKLAFSQFKKIYENQGDTVRANKYRAEELKIYQKQITLWSNFDTWLVLGLSNITSNFGQSIWRPLVSLIVVHYILFSIAYWSGSLTIEEGQSQWYYYIITMSPIHSFDLFVKDGRIIIDVLMRAWSSYMIYNFIRASRRFIN